MKESFGNKDDIKKGLKMFKQHSTLEGEEGEEVEEVKEAPVREKRQEIFQDPNRPFETVIEARHLVALEKNGEAKIARVNLSGRVLKPGEKVVLLDENLKPYEVELVSVTGSGTKETIVVRQYP